MALTKKDSRLYHHIGLLLLLWFFSCSLTYSQDFQIKLAPKSGANNAYSHTLMTGRVTDISSYSGLDTISYKPWRLGYVTFNNSQNLKELVISGKLKQKEFTEYVKNHRIDTANISQQTIAGNNIAVFVGFAKDGRKVMLVDSDNDHNLADEKEYSFDSKGKREFPIVDVLFQYYKAGRIESATIPLRVNAFEDFASPEVEFVKEFYYEGFFTKKDTSFVVHISDEYYGLYEHTTHHINIREIPTDTLTNYKFIYGDSDVIPIGNNQVYKFAGISSKVASFTLMKETKNTYAKLGLPAPDITGLSLQTSADFQLLHERGRYVIINFWGTWCAPCIKEIPYLRLLHEKYSGKGVTLISLAFDKVEDYDKVLATIKVNKMQWEQLFIDKGKKDGTVMDYMVSAFPTTFLLDPKGTIVLRCEGSNALSEIDTYLTLKLF